MFEETVSMVSIWSSLNSWLTPTVLFVLLNLMIGTIAVTSGLGGAHKSRQQPTSQPTQQPPQLTRSPSVLQRLKSINLYSARSQQPLASADADPTTVVTPNQDTILGQNQAQEEVISFEGEEPTLDQVYSRIQGGFFGRSKSDTKPTGGEMTLKLPKKMNKAASDASAFVHFEPDEEEEVGHDDDEVDAKADDFINNFRQQLKLQKLEYNLTYKEMIAKGSDK
ncbi:hypothetical protein Nepgr_000952 [Nepenthes gracilis]|uniref:DUF4408 domain-containing protein n=1 Tax=Nepenthes gracilis TaxID=150966 RepID=A0AAD3P4B5_NEPGR|nr:hypothetical protein Nepgr_000952 [Nepenthes gracilis]